MRENLKSARKWKGMTQQDMADKLGLELSAYQKIEYGDLDGSFAVWDALEDLLGVRQKTLREISSDYTSMSTNERRSIYYNAMNQDVPMCANCKYFYLHYIPNKIYGFRPIDIGHCCKPRLKSRMVYDTCSFFENKHPVKDDEICGGKHAE